MTDPRANPTEGALPDELLLDLVEGTLASSELDRVRAALKNDPRLAERLEALRADRSAMRSMAKVAAPAGLVAGAMESVERAALIENPPAAQRASSGALPYLAAAAVLIAAGIGVTLWQTGVLEGQEPMGPNRIVSAQGDDDGDLSRQGETPKTDEQLMRERAAAVPDLVAALTGAPALVDTQDLLAAAQEAAPSRAGSDDGLFTASADPAPNAAGNSSTGTSAGAASAPRPVVEPEIPAGAVALLRAGRLGVVIESRTPQADTEGHARAVARALRFAYDPSMSAEWAITKLPSAGPLGIAQTAGPGPSPIFDAARGETTDADARGPIAGGLRVNRDASEAEVRALLVEMAGNIASLTRDRVRLVELPETGNASSGPRPALTVPSILWWARPVEQWTPEVIYRLPVETRLPESGAKVAPADPNPSDSVPGDMAPQDAPRGGDGSADEPIEGVGG